MASPSPVRRRLVSLLAMLPWPLLLFECLLVVPRYERLFREYGLRASAVTQLFLDVSGWAAGHVVLAFLLTLLCMGVSVGVAYRAQAAALPRGRRLLVLLLVFGAPCGLFGLVWVGMLGTHRTLVEGLQR